MNRLTALAVLLIGASAGFQASADGLDRDTLLTDAPAVPDKGTVRITGGVTGTSDSTGIDATQGQANLVAGLQWTPFERFAADVSAYFSPAGASTTLSAPASTVASRPSWPMTRTERWGRACDSLEITISRLVRPSPGW
jgi:hypothetical protein